MSDYNNPTCAKCSVKIKICEHPQGTGPEFCPTKNMVQTVDKSVEEYKRSDVADFAKMASLQEAECYTNRHIKPYVLHPTKPRVQEVVEFANKMGYKKLGIAFCAALRPEARQLTKILEIQGFEVSSVVCKVGCSAKEIIGLNDEQKVYVGEFESMCSPIAQANVLNEIGTEFNVLVGLCVGHDSLFFKYSKAYATVLVAKDRVSGHNPAGALYTSSTYYARLLRPGIEPSED